MSQTSFERMPVYQPESSVVDPNTFNLDPGPDQDLGLCYNFEETNYILLKINGTIFFLKKSYFKAISKKWPQKNF